MLYSSSEFDALLAFDGGVNLRETLAPFGRFIGDWSVEVANFDEEGNVVRRTGEWIWRPILNGRGVQDVWIVPERAARSEPFEEYEWGTSIRFYDASIDKWRSTWIGPVHGRIVPFIARTTTDGIVLRGVDPQNGRHLRWSFLNIGDVAFDWTNYSSGDAGSTWRQDQTMHVRRISS